MTPATEPPAQIAVWYFIGATFAFALPPLLFQNADPWVRILTTVLGFVLIIAGGYQLNREMRERRSGSDEEPPSA